MSDVAARVKKVIVKQLNVKAEEVTPDASIRNDLGADDIDVTELIMALGDEFGTEIPDEESEQMTKVGTIVKYFDKYLDSVDA
ncbi:acyl carrier protein [Streptomyces nojiriensis]|uniref:acyl carrier protein n=1 Tax=Streptomyces nojiriensis TaxID=66374 RepID=UPI0035DF4CC4